MCSSQKEVQFWGQSSFTTPLAAFILGELISMLQDNKFNMYLTINVTVHVNQTRVYGYYTQFFLDSSTCTWVRLNVLTAVNIRVMFSLVGILGRPVNEYKHFARKMLLP